MAKIRNGVSFEGPDAWNQYLDHVATKIHATNPSLPIYLIAKLAEDGEWEPAHLAQADAAYRELDLVSEVSGREDRFAMPLFGAVELDLDPFGLMEEWPELAVSA